MDAETKLQLLLKLGKELFCIRDQVHMFEVMNNLGRELVEADRCSIFIYDRDKDELWTKTAHNVEEIRVPAGKGVVGGAVNSNEIQLVLDAYNDSRFNQEVDRSTGYLTDTILAVPLRNRSGENIGVFQALNSKNGYFSTLDTELAILLSDFISASLENWQQNGFPQRGA